MDLSYLSDPPNLNDVYISILSFFLILTLISVSSVLKKYLGLKEENSRKIVHISVGSMAALAPFYFSSVLPLLVFAVLFFVIDWLAIQKGFFKSIHGQRFSYGTVYFPIAYLILLIIFWPINKNMIAIGILFFAIPDAIAALVGQNIKKPHRYRLIKDEKSIEGSIAHFVSGLVLLLIYFSLANLQFATPGLAVFLFSVLTISLLVTIVESLSSKGSDNLFVPLSSAIITYIFVEANSGQMQQIFLGLLLSLLIIILSYRLKFLDGSGLAVTFLLATAIFGLGGLKWTVPILVFFIFSSLLSKAGKGIKDRFKDTFEKSGVRDYAQVIANGGIGGILVVIYYFFPHEIFYYLYIISLAVATADTWGTEIGIMFGKKPRLITNFRKVEPGISGAISFYGSLGAFLGSVILVLSGAIFINPLTLEMIILLALLGFLGSFIDSFIGATIQGQFRCMKCGKYTEKRMHCGVETDHERGLLFFNNDRVNITAAIVAILIFIFL